MVHFGSGNKILYKSTKDLQELLKEKSEVVVGKKGTFCFVSFQEGETNYYYIPCIRRKTEVWITKKTVRSIIKRFGCFLK